MPKRSWRLHSARIVDAFASGYFEGCLKMIEKLEQIVGPNDFAACLQSLLPS